MTNIQYLTQQVDIQEFKTRFYKKHGVSLHILTEEQTGFKLMFRPLSGAVMQTQIQLPKHIQQEDKTCEERMFTSK